MTGRVGVDPAAGFPADLRVTATNAQVLSSDIVSATTNLGLQITGPLARTPRVAGRIDIVSMDVSVPDRLPDTSSPLPGTKYVKPTKEAAIRLAHDAEGQGRTRPKPVHRGV